MRVLPLAVAFLLAVGVLSLSVIATGQATSSMSTFEEDSSLPLPIALTSTPKMFGMGYTGGIAYTAQTQNVLIIVELDEVKLVGDPVWLTAFLGDSATVPAPQPGTNVPAGAIFLLWGDSNIYGLTSASPPSLVATYLAQFLTPGVTYWFDFSAFATNGFGGGAATLGSLSVGIIFFSTPDLPTSVVGTCPSGEAISGINSTGGFTCSKIPTVAGGPSTCNPTFGYVCQSSTTTAQGNVTVTTHGNGGSTPPPIAYPLAALALGAVICSLYVYHEVRVRSRPRSLLGRGGKGFS